MFSPRTPSTRARSSPYTPSGVTPRAQNRRVSNIFTPKGRQSSLTQKGIPNRSLQTSQLIEETEGYRIEGFGTPLPVLITEALALADKHTEITVKIDQSGWAWLVGGRKLFVWRYKGGQSTRTVFCKELTLPPSDLAHNADRVCVIPSVTDNQSASCIAVSPEGIVRYWPNIAYEGSSTEISAELRGDECASVVNFEPFGCLLATTTSSLVLLLPMSGQNTLTCHPLKGSQGMFSGIGRRMSSFIFGASTLQPSGAPLQAIVCGKCEDEDERSFFVLSGTQFQKWNISQPITEKLFYQIDVERMFREFLSKKVWNQDSRQLTQLKTWLLDMQPTQHGVVFLGAGVNMDVDLTVHFGLAFLDTDINGTPNELESLMILEHQDVYSEDFEYSLQKHRLLLADPRSTTAYIYDREHVLFVPGPSTEVINLQQPGGHILGAGTSDGVGVFFSGSMGLFSISTPQRQEISIMEEPVQDMTTADMSVLTASHAKMQELSMSEDRTARLKSAFIATMRGNIAAAQATIEELFPLDEVSTDLDQTVVSLDKDLVDDFPASDPRWAESRQDATSSTTSLIIINQLNDKLRAHEYVINFLKKMNLWEQLKQVTVRGTRMLTRHVMCEQRCVGVEVCTIRPDLLRCRGCCEWYVVDKDGGLPRNATDSCKYFELSKNSVESRGTRWSANLTAGTSSTYINNYGREFPASNVLDGLYGSYCLFANVYASHSEINPWLEVTWSGTITIWRIIIYNRVECCGSRLVNLKVTYQNKGITGICGFYPGLLSRDGDIILFYCLPEAYATSVKLQIQSKAEQTDILNLCEVEIYKKT